MTMATKPPPGVAEFSQDTIEKLAYSVVADIPTMEPNDRNRLGYHIWAWLRERQGTLQQAVKTSGARTEIPLEEVYEQVKARLVEKGVKVE
jgi:hypothetical protein